MTFTNTLQSVSGSTEAPLVPIADRSDLVLVSTVVDAKTGRVTSIFTIPGADAGYPVTLTVAVDPADGSQKSRYASFTFRTWLKQTSDVEDTVTYWPVQATSSLVIAADAPLTVANLMALCGVAFSYTYASLASGVRDTAYMARILAGTSIIK